MLRSLQAGKAHSKQLSSRLLLLGFPSEVGGASRSCSGGGRVCGARKTGSGEHPAELRGGVAGTQSHLKVVAWDSTVISPVEVS